MLCNVLLVNKNWELNAKGVASKEILYAPASNALQNKIFKMAVPELIMEINEIISTHRLKVGGAPMTPRQQIDQNKNISPIFVWPHLFKTILRV